MSKSKSNFTVQKQNDIFNKYNGRCSYCGNIIVNSSNGNGYHFYDQFTVDHIVPLAKGGTNVKTNLIPACYTCNWCKDNMDIEEFRKEIKLRIQLQALMLQLHKPAFLPKEWLVTLKKYDPQNVVFWLDTH